MLTLNWIASQPHSKLQLIISAPLVSWWSADACSDSCALTGWRQACCSIAVLCPGLLSTLWRSCRICWPRDMAVLWQLAQGIAHLWQASCSLRCRPCSTDRLALTFHNLSNHMYESQDLHERCEVALSTCQRWLASASVHEIGKCISTGIDEHTFKHQHCWISLGAVIAVLHLP